MKKLLFLLAPFLLLALFPSRIYAEDIQPITTGDYFDVELTTGTQSAWTKRVPLIIKFKANIDASKVEISWDVPSDLRLKTSHPKFIRVEKGQVYVYKASVKPSRSGTFNIAGNVTAWELKTNYTSSGYKSLTFNEDLITSPKTPGYDSAVIVKALIIFLLIMGLCAGFYFGAKIGLSRLKEWLKPPE